MKAFVWVGVLKFWFVRFRGAAVCAFGFGGLDVDSGAGSSPG